MNNNDIKSKVFSGLLWKFGERITAQLVSLVVSIILARILEPADYGAVAILMIFITIANVFVSSGFGNSLIQKKDADNLDFSSVFFINIGISILLYLVLFICAPYIASFYELDILCPTLRVLSIRIIVAAINSVQHAYVSRHMLFKRFFYSTLFGTVLSGIVGIWMAYHGYGVWALVAQYLTNTCTDTIVLWFTVKWRPIYRCSWKRAKSLLSFGWKLLVSSLIDTGYNQLRSLLIGKLYTKEYLAYYNQGDKYPSLIVTNINSSISGVLFPALSEQQNDKEKVKKMTRRAVQISSFIMWPLMFGLGVCSEPFIRLILTEKWLPCVPYLRLFCLSYGFWPIHTANLQAINAMGRSDLFLKLEIIKKTIGICVLLVTLRMGPFAIAFGLVITGILSTIINGWPNKELLHYSLKEQFSDLLPSMFIAAIMGACIYPISFIRLPDIIILILQVITGMIMYLFISKATNNSSYDYLINGIIKTKKR